MSRKIFSLDRVTHAVAFIFVLSIPFTTKKLLYPFASVASERTSIFLYGMDIGLALLLLMLAWRRARTGRVVSIPRGTKIVLILIGAFLLVSLASVLFSSSLALSLYTWARLLVVVLSGAAISYAFLSRALDCDGAALALGLSATLQSIIGFFQFISGASVGLRYLGESVITSATTGVARVAIQGAPFLRAYGTMQHANILAGFLGLGFIALCFLWFRVPERRTTPFGGEFLRHLALATGMFITVFGLLLTFSRSGWLAFAAGTVCFFAFIFAKKGSWHRSAWHLLAVLAAIIALTASMMWWAVAPRVAALTVEDPSVNYRLRYDIMGMQIVARAPQGVGIGNQVAYSVARRSYQKLDIMRPIDWQPIHNLYLLIASETGVAGLLLFLTFLGFLIAPHIPLAFADEQTAFALSLFALLLIFGLFDHFLWTLESGRLMLWVALGLVFASGMSSHRSTS